MPLDLTLAESGALALADAAAALNGANDMTKFLQALERNRQVWATLKDVAERREWRIPNARLAEYALKTSSRNGRGVNDEQVHALIEINRRIAQTLVDGGDVEAIRRRAHTIWESRGRPCGNELEHWLLAEMELKAAL